MADATAVSLVHPLRWPGSWHRKHEPRLARIVDLRPDVEIEPSEVVELLEPLIPVQRATGGAGGRSQHAELDDDDLAALGEIIANSRPGVGRLEPFGDGLLRRLEWIRGRIRRIRSGLAAQREVRRRAIRGDAGSTSINPRRTGSDPAR